MSRAPAVTLCIPVWQAEAFAARTIDSALGQSYPHLRVLLSVDLSTDRSVDVCRSFADDPRVEVAEQRRRLGWVGNVNFLLDNVSTPYYSVLFHDDWIVGVGPVHVDSLFRDFQR